MKRAQQIVVVVIVVVTHKILKKSMYVFFNITDFILLSCFNQVPVDRALGEYHHRSPKLLVRI